MAYPYRNSYGSRDDKPPTNFNRLSGGMMNGAEQKTGGLMRRFTTNALPTLSPIGQQRRQAAGETQASGLLNRATPSERRIRHIEQLLEQQRSIEAELEKIDNETRREVEQGLRHERAVSDIISQSEPTSPPSEAADVVPNVMRRSNRYSMNSMASGAGIISNSSRSSAQLTSPSVGIRPYSATAASTIPSQSVPGSRRHSDNEDDDDFLLYDTGVHRSAAKPNRNSMPVPTYDRKRNALDRRSLNTTSFLFDDDEPSALPSKPSNKTSPPDTKTYLQMQHTADGFPKLIRRGDTSDPLSSPSAALDLALSPTPSAKQQVAELGTASRHRFSLPPSVLNNGNIAPLNSILANTADSKAAANLRRSLEVKFTAETKRPTIMASPHRISMPNGVPKAPTSYSTNDIPTLKSIEGENNGGVSLKSYSNRTTEAEQATSPESSIPNLNRHSSSVSVTSDATRQTSELNGSSNLNYQNLEIFNSISGALQGGAAPFGSSHLQELGQMPQFQAQSAMQNGPVYYGNNGMASMTNGFNNMSLNGNINTNSGYGAQGQFADPSYPVYQQGLYPSYPNYPNQAFGGAGRYGDNPRSQTQTRKAQADDFYNSMSLPELVGQIYGLCKDQHGCRFLQRKLEERKSEDMQIIFEEVKDHFPELMIDPFGNYLCQRLLEFATDEQRTVLVEKAVPAMTRIALNQHGTRALQRMIESITLQEQRNMVIEALRWDVVQLIQDLNGNHVIQKCLNHLTPEDAQFIFDAVGANCVAVGTHRHGCCVLQRCVDHATGLQKGALIDHIINNAFSLVQDPFGNYVVQYIIDLSEPCFTEPLCLTFSGNVGNMSKQKFSSNVIEKCIRCGPKEVKRMLICEIMMPVELEGMLRDSFANYVIQTAMDFAAEDIKPILIENIRPLMHLIRHTPHGRRIASKIQEYDAGLLSAGTSNTVSPDAGAGINGRAHRNGMIGAPPHWAGNNGFGQPFANGSFAGNNIVQPTPQRSHASSFLNGQPNHPEQNRGRGPNPNQNPTQGYGNTNGYGNGYANGYGYNVFGHPQPPYGHF